MNWEMAVTNQELADLHSDCATNIETSYAAVRAQRQSLSGLLYFSPAAGPGRLAMADALRSAALTDELTAARQEPSSDGLVLAGTALHARALMWAYLGLSRHFRKQPGLFITTHLPL